MAEQSTITSLSKENRVILPKRKWADKSLIKSLGEYERLHAYSLKHPEKFWREQAKQISWKEPFSRVFRYTQKPFCEWFVGGKLNASFNCLDRHIQENGDKIAILWQGEPEHETRAISYRELLSDVCKCSKMLGRFGVKKRDRVCLYLPMIPELVVAMLACARIGAIHTVVFGGFSSAALAKRIDDSGAKMVITADGYFRRGQVISLKLQADEALQQCKSVKKVVVVKRAGNPCPMVKSRDCYWGQELANSGEGFVEPVGMDSEDPLFILYTSGTTGTPKGMVHTTGGYLVYAAYTARLIFGFNSHDIFWCTADIGWITGHTYVVYGPLLLGATVVMYEGAPDFPAPDRFWHIVDKFRVTILYTAPTAIRAFMKSGNEFVLRHNLSSLRLLGTVGEPINPEAWMWYYRFVGKEKCPIVDTWWQTETGGILISPLPGATPLKPGSAAFPLPGIEALVVDENGKKIKGDAGGNLVIKGSWPGIARTIWKNPKRYVETYFSKFRNKYYFTGDSAKVDGDGYFWLMGRLDDVIKVAGHRIGTAEVESALVSHPSVAEAAVVPVPHPIKGEAIFAYVVLKEGFTESKELEAALAAHVRKEIGPIATPEKIRFAEGLPKTRSGKIMRRILKAIAVGSEDIGDVSTLADAGVVEKLQQAK